MDLKFRNVVLIGMLLVCPLLSFAATPKTLNLGQAYVAYPEVALYLDILDEMDAPIDSVQADQVQASIGDIWVTVTDLTPFAETGKGIGYVLLVDVSKSLKADQFDQIKAALHDWVDAMSEADRVALVSFGSEVKTLQDFTASQDSLHQRVDGLALTDNHTRLHEGLVRAMELGRRTDPDLPRRRVIVILSDGLDDYAGGMNASEVLRQMEENRVPVYAIGFFNAPRTASKEQGLKTLGQFARESGGVYLYAGTQPFRDMYAQLRTKIRQVFVAQLNCSAANADGHLHPLQVHLTVDAMRLSRGMNIRLLPPPPAPRVDGVPIPPSFWQVYGIYFVGGIFLLGLAAFVVLRWKQPEEDPSPFPKPNKKEGNDIIVPSPMTQVKLKFAEINPSGPASVYECTFSNKMVIGRGGTCDLSLSDDREISNQHCELTREEDRVMIKDLNSRNGTSVNGVRLKERRRLDDGDFIQIGRKELRVSFL